MKLVLIPQADAISKALEIIGVGTNSNWTALVVQPIIRLAGSQIRSDELAEKVAKALHSLTDNAPRDLYLTTRMKVPAICALLVCDSKDAAIVVDMVNQQY